MLCVAIDKVLCVFSAKYFAEQSKYRLPHYKENEVDTQRKLLKDAAQIAELAVQPDCLTSA